MRSKIVQTKFMTKEVFNSLCEETKIRMTENQFFIPPNNNIEFDDILDWIRENVSRPFYVRFLSIDSKRRWIYFYDEIDAAAFKLRWVD